MNEFDHKVQDQMIGNSPKRKSRMSSSEVISIMILFQLSACRNFKSFYLLYVKKHLKAEFPGTVSYNRFVELQKQVVLPLAVFAKTCCLGDCTGISFIDSTPLRVCNNKRIFNHKVFQGIVTRGKSTMGYFYGFIRLCCMNKSSKKKHSYGLIAIGLSHLFTNRHTKACHYI